MEQFVMFICIILFLVAFAIGVGLYFALRRSLDRIIVLEGEISGLENQNTEALNANLQFNTWFEELKARIIYTYQRIKIIDASGHFEADDEVGYFFKELKELIERLHQMGIIDEVEKEEALAVTTPKITTEEIQKVLAQRNASISSVGISRETKG